MHCVHCGDPVEIRDGVCVHAEGRRLVVDCRSCGWIGETDSPVEKCPECGSSDVNVDHVATADRLVVVA